MHQYRRIIARAVLALGLLVVSAFTYADIRISAPQAPADAPPDSYAVTKTIDGDTIDVLMHGETKRIRMIGVDTPETKDPRKGVQCFGKEAAAFTKRMLEHQFVRLVPDATQDHVDMYGRLLRYVILPDGTNFNERLIADGYAYEYTYKTPYEHQAAFKSAEQEARAERRGLWADNACDSLK